MGLSLLLGMAGDCARPDSTRAFTALKSFPGIHDTAPHSSDTFAVALAHGSSGDRANRPYTCAGGRYSLTLEGWLANRDDLATQLDLRAEGLTAPPSDRIIVATALLRWGRDALPKLHGDFALAWWDQAEQRLLLAVDRTGGRPLFYYTGADGGGSGQICFASLLPPLFTNPRVPRTPDPAAIARAAFTPSVDFSRTCFQGIRQLLPAHMLEWTATGGAVVRRYWQLDPSRRLTFRHDAEYVEAGRALLDTVVGQALPRQGKAAFLLSAGLDSSAVAATAARLTAPAPLHTITLRPDDTCPLPDARPGDLQDEWPQAQAVPRMHPSMVPHAVSASLAPLEDSLRLGFFWSGRPPIHLLAPSWMAAAWQQARQLGASTVFVGLSGNATLSGSSLPQVRPRLRDLPQALHTAALAASLGRPVLPYLQAMAPGWMRRARIWVQGGLPPRWQTALTPEAAELIALSQVQSDFQYGTVSTPWMLRSRQRLMERTWQARTLSSSLHFRDGVERRDPLGDIRLAEFCLAIPPGQFTRFGKDRLLARRVLADRLPAPILQTSIRGRQGAEWFSWVTRSRPFLAAELDGIEASALGRGLIDVPRLRRILDDWPTDDTAAQPHYQRVMNILGRGVAVGAFIRWAEGANR